MSGTGMKRKKERNLQEQLQSVPKVRPWGEESFEGCTLWLNLTGWKQRNVKKESLRKLQLKIETRNECICRHLLGLSNGSIC
jgi:hypothetical protein